MWQGQGQDAGGKRVVAPSLSRNASSTDSFEDFMSDFEVVNTGASPAAAPKPQLAPLSPNPFTAFLSRSPFKNIQGRPPRPDLQISSQPYQSKRRSQGAPTSPSQPSYQSQLLLPVPSSPPQSLQSFAGRQGSQSYPGPRQTSADAVILTPTSPAVASAVHHSPTADAAQQRWMAEADRHARAPHQTQRGWMPEADCRDMQSVVRVAERQRPHDSFEGDSSEEETLRWGAPPREDLWPLGMQLPALYQAAAEQPGGAGQPGSEGQRSSGVPRLALSSSASGDLPQHAAGASPLPRTLSGNSPRLGRRSTSIGSVIVQGSPLQDGGREVMDFRPTTAAQPAEPPPSGYPSPFAVAALRPSSPSSSNGSQDSPQNSLKSESDYGSSDGPRLAWPAAREFDRLSEADLPSSSETAATRPGSVSDYGSHVSEERGPTGNTSLASIPERLVQLSRTGLQGAGTGRQPADEFFKAGHQRLYMGGAANLAQPGPDPRGAFMGRSNLRKRDFESELLERLLSQGGYRGHAASPPAKAIMDTRVIWRAIGVPKIAFITAVFLCLVLSLLLFTGGRLHAQRVMRSRAEMVGIISIAPLGILDGAALGGNITGMEHLMAGTSGDVRHRHSSSSISYRGSGHAEDLLLQAHSVANNKDADEAHRHERHSGSQEGESADLNKRAIAGLRLLQASSASLKLATSGLRLRMV